MTSHKTNLVFQYEQCLRQLTVFQSDVFFFHFR